MGRDLRTVAETIMSDLGMGEDPSKIDALELSPEKMPPLLLWRKSQIHQTMIYLSILPPVLVLILPPVLGVYST